MKCNKCFIYRLLETLYHGYQSRNSTKDWYHRRQCYERMLDENTDCNLVRLFETFLENAPQLVLQLYVVSQIGTSVGHFLGKFQGSYFLNSHAPARIF